MTCNRDEPTARWGLLYAAALVLILLCGGVEVFVPTGALRVILQLVAVMMGFGLMGLWIRCNRVALELEQTRSHRLSAKPAEQNGNHVGWRVRSHTQSANEPVALTREMRRER